MIFKLTHSQSLVFAKISQYIIWTWTVFQGIIFQKQILLNSISILRSHLMTKTKLSTVVV